MISDDVIDGLHLELLIRIQKTAREISREDLLTELLDIVDEWTKHVVHETNFMRDIGFPCIAYHMEDHKRITQRFADAVFAVRNSKAEQFVSYNTVSLTNEVLLTHFDSLDMQLIPYLPKD